MCIEQLSVGGHIFEMEDPELGAQGKPLMERHQQTVGLISCNTGSQTHQIFI